MSRAATVKWTREHLLMALNLYCKLPFGKLHRHNPIIIEVAGRMGRTPNSLAMKLCNFASLDPVQQARGVHGLPGASRQDRAVWEEFQAATAELGLQSEQLIHDLFTADNASELDFVQHNRVTLSPPSGPTEASSTVRVRRGQQFFRQAILNAYGLRCCITGIPVPRLLVASHIKPWRDFPAERLNPRNGLCLSVLHDAAFDSGLIALDGQLRVLLSKRLRSCLPQRLLQQNFAAFEGRRIRLPAKLAEPDPAFLAYHREQVFQG